MPKFKTLRPVKGKKPDTCIRVVHNSSQAKELKQGDHWKASQREAEESTKEDVQAIQCTVNNLTVGRRTRSSKGKPKTTAAGTEGKSCAQETQKKPRLYICQFCGLSVSCSTSLHRHLRVHTGEKPFSCLVCGKEFARSSTLRCHERIHTGERPYPCTQCHLAFAQSSSLRDHQKIHSGLRAFICSTCGKSFTKRNGLTRHEAIHDGIKPHKCSYCQKSFVQSNALVEHERTHTGQRPFRCSLCPWDFAQSSQLRSHMKTHSNSTATRKPRKRKENAIYLNVPGTIPTPVSLSQSASSGNNFAKLACNNDPLIVVDAEASSETVVAREKAAENRFEVIGPEHQVTRQSLTRFPTMKPVTCNKQNEGIADIGKASVSQTVQFAVQEAKTQSVVGVQTMQLVSMVTHCPHQSVAQGDSVDVTAQLVPEVMCIPPEELEEVKHVFLVQMPDKTIKQL